AMSPDAVSPDAMSPDAVSPDAVSPDAVPSAAEHRANARRFEELAARLLAAYSDVDVAWAARPVRGGRLERALDHSVEVTHGNVIAAIAHLHDLAAESERRAVLCDHVDVLDVTECADGAPDADADADVDSDACDAAPDRLSPWMSSS
ncbi:MAG: hypothetical protein AAGG08_10235, partial [Actinomycetota bacterium]